MYWGLFEADVSWPSQTSASAGIRAASLVVAKDEALNILKKSRRTPSLSEGVEDTFLADRLSGPVMSAQLPKEARAPGPMEDEPRYIEGLSDPIFKAKLVGKNTDLMTSYGLGYAAASPAGDFDAAIEEARTGFKAANLEDERSSESPLSPKALCLGLLQATLQYKDDSESASALEAILVDGKELRRLDHAVRWTRRDPVDEIAPGMTSEVSVKVTLGVSEQQTESLASSLGFKVGVDIFRIQTEVNDQLTRQVSTSLSISRTEEDTRTIRLENPTADTQRLYAIWHLNNRLRVSHLTWSKDEEPSWEVCSEVEFLNPGAAATVKMFSLPA
jgi:hypothetical protein